jgi:HD-GYP domain-containing protein (c-di-GMP phosphodiesterase class II)
VTSPTGYRSTQPSGALQHSFERWDGKGIPNGRAGEQIDAVMRIVHIADDAEVYLRVGGADAAMDMLRSRRGTEFDPALVDLFCANTGGLVDELEAIDSWDAITSDDSALGPELTEGELTGVLQVFGDYADLKSPSRLGHSRGVAQLAAEGANRLGLPAAEVTRLERAALVHDLGVIGVSTGVWDKPGPLSSSERERVRTHPYLTERVLARPPQLASIGGLAGLHHERVDGSGYPRGLHGDALSMAARVIAAADVCNAVSQARPHRRELNAAEAATLLRDEVTAGLLDGEAVNAVLGAAGHRVRRRPGLPSGLTPREVEVLALLARGVPNKVIAERLSLSARTVRSHIEHVYAKIGVSTRGAAAMFAMRHGLVSPTIGD